MSRRIKCLNVDNIIYFLIKIDLMQQIIIQVKTIEFNMYLRRVQQKKLKLNLCIMRRSALE